MHKLDPHSGFELWPADEDFLYAIAKASLWL
jgi:hypothetical protein